MEGWQFFCFCLFYFPSSLLVFPSECPSRCRNSNEAAMKNVGNVGTLASVVAQPRGPVRIPHKSIHCHVSQHSRAQQSLAWRTWRAIEDTMVCMA